LRGETELTATLHIKVMITHSWDSIQEREREKATPKGNNFLTNSRMAQIRSIFGFHIQEDHGINLNFSVNKS